MIVPFPVAAYTSNSMLILMDGIIYSLVFQPMITPFLIFLFQLLTEKKEKIKEYMKIMGLTDTAYYSS